MWAAWPGRPGGASATPVPALRDRQQVAEADVFYIYPTVYTGPFRANADLDDPRYRRDVDRLLLRSQASALNGVGRIYAPFYRQAGLWTYLGPAGRARRAFALARDDVKAALEFYLRRVNRGRPLILLAHSQGSQIAVGLLEDPALAAALSRVLVVAYLIGERIAPGRPGTLAPCQDATATGCFVTWATVREGAKPRLLTGAAAGPAVCVNPLNWRPGDGDWVPAARHLGGVPDSFDRIEPRLVSARCRNGLLEIRPPPAGYAHLGGDYHESDINLFYMDLRRNAAQRLRAWQNRRRRD